MKILYLHWDDSAGFEGLSALFERSISCVNSLDAFRRWLELEPEVVAINLDEHPAQGREAAHHVKSTLVFVGGTEEAILHAMNRYPEAIFCESMADLPAELLNIESQTWSA